jgi:hypothetical protein
MSAVVSVVSAYDRSRSWSDQLQSWRDNEPGFFGLGLVMLAAMAPTAFAALVDHRTFLGFDNWVKPLKFEAALFVYLLTLAFFARWLPEGVAERRWYRIYRAAVMIAITAEMIWIAGAAGLGVASHFNRSPAGTVIYSLMGAGAVLLTTPTAVYAWLIARNRQARLTPGMKEAVVTGLALVLPLTLITAGTMSSMDGHAIGGAGATGGAFPVMGWSRDGGDLRVAHFFATHALHFIPAFALSLAVFFKSTSPLPIRLFTIGFVVFVGWTFVQALMGRPFLPEIG